MIDFETEQAPKQAVLASVQLPGVDDDEHEHSLAELGRLAKTLGLTVVGQISQRRDHFDPGAYVGSGKREELKRMIESGQANLILIDPGQPVASAQLETKRAMCCRTPVSSRIFHRPRRSRAERRVEIVRMKYMARACAREQGGLGSRALAKATASRNVLDRADRDRIAS